MYYSIPQKFNNRVYFFCFQLGLLLSKVSSSKKENRDSLEPKYLQWVDEPYCLKHRDVPKSNFKSNYAISKYAHLLVFLCKHCYLLAYLISYLRLPVFEDAGLACTTFKKIVGGDQTFLCLPRSIFIATTSKRFKKNGAMYIGVFLPSRQMHAWVIEDQMSADVDDCYWQMYTPVCVMK